MLLNRGWYESGDAGHGDWTREQLVDMDSRFCEALEAAFQTGGESRAVATATVRVTQPRGTEEAAISAAWAWFWQKDADVPFCAVVEFVRIRSPRVTAECVRAGFERRRRSISFADGGGVVGRTC
jgi:hypothetical protein